MYQLDDVEYDDIVTIHMYVYHEPERKLRRPGTLRRGLRAALRLMMLTASFLALCFVPTDQPLDTIQTITVPARFLPLTQLKASGTIVPTGLTTYPAVAAHGTLTLYNGSILAQRLPEGFIVTSAQGVEIVTDAGVTIPPGEPPSYGIAVVAAHAAQAGVAGNIAPYTVQAVYGADVYLKNLTGFSGGAEAHSVRFATSADAQQALLSARDMLSAQEHHQTGLLAAPCQEKAGQTGLVLNVSWTCQFVTFTPPPGAQVLAVHLSGKLVVLHVRWLGVS